MTEILPLLATATLETLIMVGLAMPLAAVGGLILAVLLVITAPGRIAARPALWRVLSAITNFGRSIPFIILVVAIVPLTRALVGTSIGTRAAIVPLVLGAIPYAARLLEGAILEVDPGVVEAVIAMGASPWQLVSKVYLPETMPALIRALTIMTVTLIGYSTMAGAIGGGGLGDLAIRYGYQRFRPDVTASTVVVIVILVQTIQWGGDLFAKHFDRR